MVRIGLNGVLGRMGQVLCGIIGQNPGTEVAFGIDKNYDGKTTDFPVFQSPDQVPSGISCDVLVDFSHFTAVPGILDFALERKLPIVVCTTGLTPETKEKMKEASKEIPVFFSANMSVGVCLVKMLARKAAAFLGDDFDIEIVERHHNQKVDAPSGTAIAIAEAINRECGEKYEFVYDRHERMQKREKKELGISSVRGGSIVGDHEVIYAGPNEVIEISHHAQSRSVFADGAVRAAVFLAGKPAGMYDMESILM